MANDVNRAQSETLPACKSCRDFPYEPFGTMLLGVHCYDCERCGIGPEGGCESCKQKVKS